MNATLFSYNGSCCIGLTVDTTAVPDHELLVECLAEGFAEVIAVAHRGEGGGPVLSAALDVFRLRQYFDAVTATRQWVDGIREDAGLLTDVRRSALRFPGERPRPVELRPFSAPQPFRADWLEGRRLAVMATGGSGALASVVGVARALEEAGVRPAVITLCSGSALFGFPVAAGIPAEQVAEFVLGFQPEDYVDVDWRRLSTLVPTAGRGFAGVVRGERIEATYRRLLGDMTLGELEIPAYAPVWSVEENRLDYIGPRTHPDLSVAQPSAWPSHSLSSSTPCRSTASTGATAAWSTSSRCAPCSRWRSLRRALAINGFYPPDFAGEDATGWQDRPASILTVASQVRTCQQSELARVNLRRLRAATDVMMVEPVPYEKVRGTGFYRQFLNPSEWPTSCAGRAETRRVLHAHHVRRPGRAAGRSGHTVPKTLASSSGTGVSSCW